MKYGRAIRVARAARGLTLTALAARVGVSTSFLSLVEDEKRPTSHPQRVAIAEACGAPMALIELLAWEGPIADADALILGRAVVALVLAGRSPVKPPDPPVAERARPLAAQEGRGSNGQPH